MSIRYLNATGTQALINEIKSRLLAKADKEITNALVQRMAQLETALPTRTSQLENDSGFIASDIASELFASKSSVSELQLAVFQNTQDVALLNADAETEGSVDYKIAQVEPESISTADIESLFANLILFGASNTESEPEEAVPPTKSVEDTSPTKESEEPVEYVPSTKEPVEYVPSTEEPVAYLDHAPIYSLDELPTPVVYKYMSTRIFTISSNLVGYIEGADFDSVYTARISESLLQNSLKDNLLEGYKPEDIRRGLWLISFSLYALDSRAESKYSYDESAHVLGVYIDSDTNEFRLLSSKSLKASPEVYPNSGVITLTRYQRDANFTLAQFVENSQIHSPFTAIEFDDGNRELVLTYIPSIVMTPEYLKSIYRLRLEVSAVFYSFDKPEEESA